MSTNYWIARDGTIEQYVLDEHAAYGQGIITLGSDFPASFVTACGGTVTVEQGWIANCLYLCIEHEGHPTDGFTEAQIAASKALNHYLSAKHGYPLDRDHLFGHSSFDHVNRANCPGALFPWDTILSP